MHNKWHFNLKKTKMNLSSLGQWAWIPHMDTCDALISILNAVKVLVLEIEHRAQHKFYKCSTIQQHVQPEENAILIIIIFVMILQNIKWWNTWLTCISWDNTIWFTHCRTHILINNRNLFSKWEFSDISYSTQNNSLWILSNAHLNEVFPHFSLYQNKNRRVYKYTHPSLAIQ